MYNEPYIYESNLPTWAGNKFPTFAQAIKNKFIDKAPFNFVQNLLGYRSKFQFTAFAKTSHFNKDLYADYVSPSLGISLDVETWPNGPGRENSSCGYHGRDIENVEEIHFPFAKPQPEIGFKSTHDHSKWAVSMTKKSPWVCIGDINRMLTQFKRGGGTVCLQNDELHGAFAELIEKRDACPIKP